MDVQTSMSGGPNPAIAGGQSAGEQSGPGAFQRVTTTRDNAVLNSGQPEGRSATGNQTTGGGSSGPPSGGLANVFAGQPEAGSERVTPSGDAAANRGQPDGAGQPKGNRGPTQSNESILSSQLPQWTQQLPKKMVSEHGDHLAGFKSLDEFVQASLDAQAKAGGENRPALPGKGSSPEEVRAFYESLGKPTEAAGYQFAKNDPDFAKIAFDTNLTNAQAEAIYGISLARMDDARKGITAALARDYQATDALLQKEFGERYDEAIALLQRGLGNNPRSGELSPLAQSLVDAGLAGKPEIVRAFIELGRATSEGSAAGGSAHGGTPQSVMEGRGFSYRDDYPVTQTILTRKE